MKRIAKNTLAGWAVALLILYWVIGLTVPSAAFNMALSFGLLIAALATLWRWGPSAFWFIADKDGEKEIHSDLLSLLGVATLALGASYSGLFNIGWWIAGLPDGWLGTPYSRFGSALLMVGFWLHFRSAAVAKETLRPVNWSVVGLLVVLAALVGFFAGSQFWSSPASSAILSSSGNPCPKGTPIVGNISERGWIYHVPGNIWYAATIPEACFKTEAEARAAGFSPPR